MKLLLSLFLVISLTACSGSWKKFDRGVIKEKFITSTKYGDPEYHLITENHVYDVSGDEYAQNQVGEHYFESIYCFE